MSHEVERNEDLAYTGQRPWHGLGIEVPGHMTPREALVTAGLDWTAEKRPLHYRNAEGALTPAPDRFAVTRSDNGRFLGDVGKSYKPFQNAEAVPFIEALVGEGATVEVAGALHGGRRVFWTVKLPETLVIPAKGGDDEVETYLIVMNGHDGTQAVVSLRSKIRVVCRNTADYAVAMAASEVYKARHTGNLERKIEEARDVLQFAAQQAEKDREALGALASQGMTVGEFLAFSEKLLPIPQAAPKRTVTRLEGMRSDMLDAFRGGPGAELAGQTRWGAFNAVTAWTTHRYDPRGSDRKGDRRMDYLVQGAGRQLATQAYALLSN